MNDRGLPRSYRHLNGFGSHTYSLISAAGERNWVKFHFKTMQGIKNWTNAEAAEKIGNDRETHQRDLFEAIERGDFPKWKFSVQIMPESDVGKHWYNPFDLTKVRPHKDYPLIEVGILVVCATSDLLQDASFNVEAWLLEKVSRGFGDTINGAILLGDGIGKPLGISNPLAGIPICDTSLSTPPNQFIWQDLLMLKLEIPQQWMDGSVYLMNSKTAALLFTMSDAGARPLFSALPERSPGVSFAGSPIIICTWMPDVAGAVHLSYLATSSTHRHHSEQSGATDRSKLC